jgi:hypothetical protein
VVAVPTIADFIGFLLHLVDILYAVGAIIFLGVAIYLGFSYMTARSDETKLQEINKKIGYLVLGFILYFLSAAIVTFVYRTFQVTDCRGEAVYPGFRVFFEQSCNTVP